MILVIGAIWLGSAGPVLAQDVAPPVPVAPQRLEVSTPAAPVRMRAENAQRLVEQLHGVTVAPTAGATAQPERRGAPPGGGVSRTIAVKPPEMTNTSTHFQFRDVTERSEPHAAQFSLVQRRAAVEAYRQSLARPQGAGH
jgi:hypothetical protein